MDKLRLAFAWRYLPLTLSIIAAPFFFSVAMAAPIFGGLFKLLALVFAALALLGVRDLLQKRHAILRSHPIAGHLRFLLEEVRPEIRQYFFEDEKSGAPFSRDKRALVYQRAKNELDKRPFGTELDVYAEGFEFMRHSIAPTTPAEEPHRIKIGHECAQPYSASILNISAMSFGALSANAIRALNAGAKRGGFAHDTGEGGVSAYHRENGGDLVWEVGSGYFGCRGADGRFSPELFAQMADVDFDDVGAGIVLEAKDAIEDFAAGHDLARMLEKQHEQRKLATREIDARAFDGGEAVADVEHHRADAQREQRVLSDPTQQCPHAGHQLIERERLGQIVVGARIESEDLFAGLAARREHQHWHHAARHAQGAADAEAVVQSGADHRISHNRCIAGLAEPTHQHQARATERHIRIEVGQRQVGTDCGTLSILLDIPRGGMRCRLGDRPARSYMVDLQHVSKEGRGVIFCADA